MQPWQNLDGESYLAYEAMLQVERKEQEKKEKTTPFGFCMLFDEDDHLQQTLSLRPSHFHVAASASVLHFNDTPSIILGCQCYRYGPDIAHVRGTLHDLRGTKTGTGAILLPAKTMFLSEIIIALSAIMISQRDVTVFRRCPRGNLASLLGPGVWSGGCWVEQLLSAPVDESPACHESSTCT